jgi:pilus assembly protein CpaB
MRLRNVLLIIGVFALLAGLALAGLWLIQRPAATTAQNAAASKTSAPIAASALAKDAKTVLVAAHMLPAGTLLRAEDFAWKAVPAAVADKGAILQATGSDTKLLGAVTQRDFAAGEILLTTGVLTPSERGFLAALLSPGSRAVSIPVDASQSASGLMLPGNRIDIILTQSFENADPARKSVGETILRNLRVIAVDQRLGPVAGSGTATKPLALDTYIPKTVTLEASEGEAEILMVAGRLGRLDVAVRAAGSEDASPGKAVSAVWASDASPALKSLRRASGLVAVGAPAASPSAVTVAQQSRASVQIIRGSKVEAR